MPDNLVKCSCCRDTGAVLTAEGEPRPCSRCNSAGFDAFMAKRRSAAVAEKEAERSKRLHG